MSDITVTKIGDSNRGFFSNMLSGESASESVELGVIIDGRPVGCAVVSFEGATAFIDHFYIAQSQRRKGVGTELMERIQETLIDSGVYNAFCYFEEQPGMKEFLSDNGFYCAPTMTRYSVWTDDLILADRKKGLRKKVESIKVFPADALTSTQIKALRESLEDEGFDPSVIESGNYDPGLSFITLDDKTPRAVLLADWLTDDELIVKALASFNSGMDGLALMGAFLDAVRDCNNCLINFYMKDERIGDLITKILGDDDLLMEEAVDWGAFWRYERQALSG